MKRILFALLSMITLGAFAQIDVITNGNVGIGVSNPSNKLSVDGFIKAQGSDGRLMLENPSVTTSIYFRNRGTANQRMLEVVFGPTVRMVMNNDGNLGIGTTNPTARLSITGPSTAYPNNKALSIIANGESPNFKDQVAISSDVSNGFGIAFAGQGHHRGGIYALNTGGSGSSSGDIGIWARNGGSIFLESNRVGIGTTVPSAKLSIRDGIQGLNVLINKRVEGSWPATAEDKTVTFQSTGGAAGDIAFASGNTEIMRITKTGRIGIGVIDPNTELEVNGGLSIGTGGSYENIIMSAVTPPTTGYLGTFRIQPLTAPGSGVSQHLTHFRNGVNGGGQTQHNISIDGNLGIGTTDTFGHRLAVNGSIAANGDIIISGTDTYNDTTIVWPDYVFKDDYNLLPLKEVEKHIQEKGHLPNIPSEKEINEKGGFALGEMNKKLLEKVEELTLYLIDQHKELEKQKELIIKLEKQEERIKVLERELLELKKK